MYDVCLRVFLDLVDDVNGMCEMKPPQAIDKMFAYFAVVRDPRRQHPTTLHSLEAILTITILATICGAHHWGESEPWGQAPAQWLSEFFDLTHGIPSHDTFGRVFALLDPTKLQQAFLTWMSALANLAEEVIALMAKLFGARWIGLMAPVRFTSSVRGHCSMSWSSPNLPWTTTATRSRPCPNGWRC